MRDIVDDARRRYRPTTAVSPSGCGRRQAVCDAAAPQRCPASPASGRRRIRSAAYATPRAELVQRLPRPHRRNGALRVLLWLSEDLRGPMVPRHAQSQLRSTRSLSLRRQSRRSRNVPTNRMRLRRMGRFARREDSFASHLRARLSHPRQAEGRRLEGPTAPVSLVPRPERLRCVEEQRE